MHTLLDVPTGSHELKAKGALAYETWCKALTAADIPSPIPPVQAQRKFKAIIAPGSTAREWLAIDKAVQAGASSAVGVGLFEAAAACVKKAEEYRSRVTGGFFFQPSLIITNTSKFIRFFKKHPHMTACQGQHDCNWKKRNQITKKTGCKKGSDFWCFLFFIIFSLVFFLFLFFFFSFLLLRRFAPNF